MLIKNIINFFKRGAKIGDIAGMDQYANYFRPRVKNTKKSTDKVLQAKLENQLPFQMSLKKMKMKMMKKHIIKHI